MTKYIVALAAAGALLMVACGEPAGVPESDSTRPASAEAEPDRPESERERRPRHRLGRRHGMDDLGSGQRS